jgi:hypothetical protein
MTPPAPSPVGIAEFKGLREGDKERPGGVEERAGGLFDCPLAWMPASSHAGSVPASARAARHHRLAEHRQLTAPAPSRRASYSINFNDCNHPVATRDFPLSKRPASRLGCIAWFCHFTLSGVAIYECVPTIRYQHQSSGREQFGLRRWSA